MNAAFNPVDGDATAATSKKSVRVGRSATWSAFRRRPANVVALVFIVLLAGSAVFAPWLSPHHPNAQSLSDQFLGISSDHLLGTDDFGRDVLSRLIHAGRASVLTAPIAVVVAILIGVPAGLVAGTFQGRVDWILSRVADAMLSIPPVVAAIAIVAILEPSLMNAMFAIGFAYAPRLFRVTRGAALVAAGEEYIESARSIGAGWIRTVFGHVLPNIMGPVLVQVTLMMGFAMLAESSLSFLGLGVQIPQASWGTMLRAAYNNNFDAPYAVIPPGVAITLAILAFNTLGDGLRDALAERGRP